MDGGNPRVFIDEGLAWPQDILFLEDQGIVLVSNLNSGTINRHDSTNTTGPSDDFDSVGTVTDTKSGYYCCLERRWW